MEKGWIKLNRQIIDHWIFQDAEKFKAWIFLLCSANHDRKKVVMREGLVTIERGQLVTSIGHLAQSWGWSKERVYRFLRLLESEGMITRTSNRFKTVITLENYGKFQSRRNTNESSNESSDESPNKSTDESSDESRTRMIKNEEELKNEKEEELDQLPDGVVDSDEEDDPDAWWKEIAEEEGIPLSECE